MELGFFFTNYYYSEYRKQRDSIENGSPPNEKRPYFDAVAYFHNCLTSAGRITLYTAERKIKHSLVSSNDSRSRVVLLYKKRRKEPYRLILEWLDENKKHFHKVLGNFLELDDALRHADLWVQF